MTFVTDAQCISVALQTEIEVTDIIAIELFLAAHGRC